MAGKSHSTWAEPGSKKVAISGGGYFRSRYNQKNTGGQQQQQHLLRGGRSRTHEGSASALHWSRDKEVNKRATGTHFTYEQLQALGKIFGRLTAAKGKMDRLQFRDFLCSMLDITDDVILDRMFSVFSEDTGMISETQWINGISLLTRGPLEEKITFVYRLYDTSGDRMIGREDIEYFIHNCIQGTPDELLADDMGDAVRDIGDITFRKLDVDRNGFITPNDFYEACMFDPLLLEALGHCIPSTQHINSFLAFFVEDCDRYDAGLSRADDPCYYERKIVAQKVRSDRVTGNTSKRALVANQHQTQSPHVAKVIQPIQPTKREDKKLSSHEN